MKALLVVAELDSMLKPTIDVKLSIPSVSPRIFSIFRVTSSVRCSEAASGNCTFAMM